MGELCDESWLKKAVDDYVDEVWEDIVRDIGCLVAIRSVEDCSNAAPGMPWGPASYEALTTALAMAERLGLDAHNCEGYLGYADVPGVSETQIATIAHTDVVPEGLGWTQHPFEMQRREGYLVGRGVLDDKGPFVLSLYAAHFFARLVARSGQPLPYTLRCIIGNDEETTMGDLTWYLARYPEPAFAFSPDADFPLICGEKGLYSGSITSGALVDGRIVELDGGTVGNAIPHQATAIVHADYSSLHEKEHIEIEPLEQGCVRLIAHGKGGHASLPDGTVNAISLLVAYLLDEGIYAASEKAFLEMEHVLLDCTDGSTVGVACQDEAFGSLTLIGGTVRTVNGHFVQTVDSRFPTAITGEKITRRLTSFCAQYGCSYQEGRNVAPFYVDPETPALRALLSTYEEYSGNPGKAFTIGGGTYARHFRCACAFGPHDPAEKTPAWVGMEHGPDEAVSEESLRRALKIYIVSIARLMQLSF